MKIKILCSVLLLLPSIAFAEVNTKNGNFYITFTDILFESGGHELGLTRTYNSKAAGNGWFGLGWGSTYEARMLVMPDGSVVVKEHGNGSDSHYIQKDKNKLQAGVDRIVAQAIQQEKLDAEAAKELRGKMMVNEELRRAQVMKYGIETELPAGAKVPSNACSESAVTRIHDEYRRTSCERFYMGNVYTDYFDLKGRLIRKEKGDYKLTIHYAGMHPDRIEDTLGQKLFLKWTAAGHIAEGRSEDNKTVIRYTYDEKGNLLLSNIIGGNFYRYDYDGKNNMKQIGYIDNTRMDMQYDENDNITSVTEPDGSKTNYAYRSDPKNPSSHYWTTTTRTSTSGAQSSREEEFELTADAAGVEQLASLKKAEDNKKLGIVYDEQGRVKIVNKSGGEFAEYFYHPTLNKVSSVVTNEVSTVFTYNNDGNLIRAYNSKDQLIKLSYDRNKRISRIVETNKSEKTQRELTFRYNDLGKPVNIKLRGKGEINVEYDEQGEIAKVDSKQGAKMALEVTMAFQVLLEVIKVGGVDLKM